MRKSYWLHLIIYTITHITTFELFAILRTLASSTPRNTNIYRLTST